MIDKTYETYLHLKHMLHLVEQATDFSNTKHMASDQSLAWLLAKAV